MLRNSAFPARFKLWNTSSGTIQTGGASTCTVLFNLDGTNQTTGAITEVGNGDYNVAATAANANGGTGYITGSSNAAGCIILGVTYDFFYANSSQLTVSGGAANANTVQWNSTNITTATPTSTFASGGNVNVAEIGGASLVVPSFGAITFPSTIGSSNYSGGAADASAATVLSLLASFNTSGISVASVVIATGNTTPPTSGQYVLAGKDINGMPYWQNSSRSMVLYFGASSDNAWTISNQIGNTPFAGGSVFLGGSTVTGTYTGTGSYNGSSSVVLYLAAGAINYNSGAGSIPSTALQNPPPISFFNNSGAATVTFAQLSAVLGVNPQPAPNFSSIIADTVNQSWNSATGSLTNVYKLIFTAKASKKIPDSQAVLQIENNQNASTNTITVLNGGSVVSNASAGTLTFANNSPGYTITMNLAAPVMATIPTGEYPFDIKLIDTSGNCTTLALGKWNVMPSVTQATS